MLLSKTVLFVCVHNSGRSQIAEAFFKQMTKGKVHAISAGTQPADKVNPVIVEVMREIEIDISENQPKLLSLGMLKQADKVITMGCGTEGVCPATFTETEDWKLDDPEDKTIDKVREIREEIKKRVIGLIEEIEK